MKLYLIICFKIFTKNNYLFFIPDIISFLISRYPLVGSSFSLLKVSKFTFSLYVFYLFVVEDFFLLCEHKVLEYLREEKLEEVKCIQCEFLIEAPSLGEM